MGRDSSCFAFDPAWALRPEVLVLVARLVAEGRSGVVECGSGLSTVAIARALGALGRGHVHALEHSPGWAATTREALVDHGLEDLATVLDTPLVDGWYAPEAVGRLPADGIDLLLVDGPPAGEPGIEDSRYPALPALAARLAPNALVVLDDAERAGERRAFDRWLAEFPLERRPRPRATAVARYVPARAGSLDDESER